RGRGRAAMSEAPAGMAAPAAMAETRLRRKQLLSAEEAELFELAQAAGSGLDPEVFRLLLDTSRDGAATAALGSLFQGLTTLLEKNFFPIPDLNLPSFNLKKNHFSFTELSHWRNKSSSAVAGSQILAERSSREGSAQRVPRQPSASRGQKAAASGKSSGAGSS
ncbi:MZT2A protein, partial [Setophaga kirtlandii]|nr:MZT2A protein [Setophaga kirtlandii]